MVIQSHYLPSVVLRFFQDFCVRNIQKIMKIPTRSQLEPGWGAPGPYMEITGPGPFLK